MPPLQRRIVTAMPTLQLDLYDLRRPTESAGRVTASLR
jgi:hypothetical protein